MAIGSCTSVNFKNPIAQQIIKKMGTLDLHTHYRSRPFLNYFRHIKEPHPHLAVLEVGCGSGLNLFELSQVVRVFRADGYDLNCAAIEEAKEIAHQCFSETKFNFYCEDASKKESWRGKYDYILLLDFLEHVHNPGEVVSRLNGLLKPEGRFVVSVPTPLYPKFFGREFHLKMGHVVDGLVEEDLDKVFSKNGFKRISSKYNTGLFASLFCAFYYRMVCRVSNKYLNFLLTMASHSARTLDLINGRRFSSSLFAVYERL